MFNTCKKRKEFESIIKIAEKLTLKDILENNLNYDINDIKKIRLVDEIIISSSCDWLKRTYYFDIHYAYDLLELARRLK